MRQRSYLVDNMVSTSFLLSWSKATVAGKTYRVTVPMQGLVFDMRGVQPAYFSTFEDLKLFAPDGVTAQLVNIDKAPAGGSLAQIAYDGGAGLDPARDIRYVLQFEIEFASDVDDGADVLMSLWGKPIGTGITPPETWPTVTETEDADVTLTTTGGTPVAVAAEVVEVITSNSMPDPITVTGSFNVTGLAQNEKVEVLVDHHTDAVFKFAEYPVITAAPEGVIVTVLARGYSNDSTNGQQFVLLVENGSEDNPGYGYEGSFTVSWSRKGYE